MGWWAHPARPCGPTFPNQLCSADSFSSVHILVLNGALLISCHFLHPVVCPGTGLWLLTFSHMGPAFHCQLFPWSCPVPALVPLAVHSALWNLLSRLYASFPSGRHGALAERARPSKSKTWIQALVLQSCV